jgi:hypothetical protein
VVADGQSVSPHKLSLAHSMVGEEQSDISLLLPRSPTLWGDIALGYRQDG